MQHNWIFQLKASATEEQQSQIQGHLDALMASWKAHGTPVPGQAEIRHDRFIVVQATPGATSGCSIDSMTHGVEDILRAAGLELLPHGNILYRAADGSIADLNFREVGAAVREGHLQPDTLIFDATLGQVNDLSRFEVLLKDSWMSRYLPAEA